ncbi:MAG: insulinase family protein [Crocinitomicaceae bacterium]|nr:insulinase family protein [Crocinitomicaceae bacterium]
MKKVLLILLTIVSFGFGTIAQVVDRTKVPTPQPNPEININIPDVVTYENGLKVIVVEDHKLPQVSFQLFVDYPILKEGDKAGMASIFGELLGSGTENYPKDKFDAKVDYMGARVSTNSRGFFATSLKKHTPNLLEILSEVVTAPTFPEDEFDRIIKQTKSGLETEKSDPDAMARNVAATVNFGKDHAYGDIQTEETLDNITLEDIKSHYNKYFVPNEAYLVIVGDVTPEEADTYVKKYFLDWKKGAESKQETWDIPTYEGNNVFFVDKPGAVQSRITITHTIDLPPGHPDVIKLRLLNQILGGGSFSAHLMRNLREDKAYTYGCYSSISSDPLNAKFSAGGNFRNEVTDSAIVQILKEIEWMCNNLVDDDELRLVKNSMTGSFARSLEQERTLANFALNMARYDLPKDYYTKYLTRLEAITKEELLEVAKKYLQPENLNIIVVGNEDVAEKLEVFDTSGGMEFKDSYGNEKLKLKSAGDGVTAESIFKNYVYKRFSVSNEEEFNNVLKKIGYIQITYKGVLEQMGAEMYLTTYRGTPNKTASIMKIKSAQGNMTAQKEWFNGEAGGTFVAMQGKTKYEGEELEEKKQQNFPLKQLYYTKNPNINAELLGIDEVDGKEYYKIKISQEGEEEFGYEYYSVETGWLVMEETFTTDEEGNSITATVKYSDYQELKKGFMIPNKMTVLQGNMPIEFELAGATIKKKPKSKTFDGEF